MVDVRSSKKGSDSRDILKFTQEDCLMTGSGWEGKRCWRGLQGFPDRVMRRIESSSNEIVNDCWSNQPGWEERSEVVFGHVEAEIILHPRQDFSRNTEYMSLELCREVQAGNTHLLLNTDYSYTYKGKVIRPENISPTGIWWKLAISIEFGNRRERS